MAVIRVGVTTTGNASLTYPAGWQPGDLLILVLPKSNFNSSIPAPTGFTPLIANATNVGFGHSLALFYRWAQAGDDETPSIVYPEYQAAQLICYRGVAQIADSAISAGATSATATAPSVAGVAGGALLQAFSCTSNPNTGTWSNPGGLAQKIAEVASVDDFVDVATFDEPVSSSGATGTRSSTYSEDTFGAASLAAAVALAGNTPPNAPLVSDQGPFDRASVNRITWQFSDPDPGDSQSAAEVRYREGGTSTWTLVAINNPNNFWDSPAGTWIADLYEAQVRTADQSGAWGPFSASFFITAGDAPPGPTILDPINGQTIGTSSYTFVISAPDVDESELRLVADDGTGQPDESTILHGPFLKTTGNLREHTVEGLANNVPVHQQWRVKHDGLWSERVSARNPVSYTPPPVPVVTYTHVPSEGAVDFHITNPAPGAGEPAVSYNDVHITDPGKLEGRRATFVAANGAWRYRTPPSGFDPVTGVRVVAVAENGTTSSSETPTVNLLENAAPWTGAAGTLITETGFVARTDGISHRIERVGTTGVTALRSPSVPVEAGATYYAAAWVRPGSTARGTYMVLQWFDGNGVNVGYGFPAAMTNEVAGDWVQPGVEAVAPASAVTVIVSCQIDGVPTGEYHYWDDATLLRVTT